MEGISPGRSRERSPAYLAKRARQQAGWVFAAPYRPFFLGASLLAALAVPLWVLFYLNGTPQVGGLEGLPWHLRAMVPGFAGAVMCGYLLSATPNWSGHLPASGWPLAALFGTWALPTLLLFLPLPLPGLGMVLLEAMFPLLGTMVLAREIRRRPSARAFLSLFAFLSISSAAALMRIALLAGVGLADTVTAAIPVLLLLVLNVIALIGGKLVPSLTRTSLENRTDASHVRVYPWLDRLALLSLAAVLSGLVVTQGSGLAFFILCLFTGATHLLRLILWQGWRLRRLEVIALHAAYAWLCAGLFLLGFSALPESFPGSDAAFHAAGAGAIGGMTMAVMARLVLPRGEKGSTVLRLVHLSLALVQLAAASRVTAGIWLTFRIELLCLASAFWGLAWAIFSIAQVIEARKDVSR
ncbi:NnrS family protein [Roseibium suaedae]|uniref:Uncharacterized protein involved in response to NO n=1 Tax=Roseibium suaedae TaxID=735517 RepID=A0A1M7NWV7_9HYPH|nr:NnrS family protein [Roseibium suaedae]SHN08263.1 uncharacterized protein involved in response to NO [Roseibium suaedae]